MPEIGECRPRFKNSRYEVREQYVIYDSDSFIADVGGFLGLLLGHSAYSVYREVEDWVGRRVGGKGKIGIV
jgi:hypothetical protein